jgi:hypothetical protein
MVIGIDFQRLANPWCGGSYHWCIGFWDLQTQARQGTYLVCCSSRPQNLHSIALAPTQHVHIVQQPLRHSPLDNKVHCQRISLLFLLLFLFSLLCPQRPRGKRYLLCWLFAHLHLVLCKGANGELELHGADQRVATPRPGPGPGGRPPYAETELMPQRALLPHGLHASNHQ